MAQNSSIEWCDGTVPAVTGCDEASPGCGQCYAKKLAATRLAHLPQYAGLATMRDGVARWSGEFRLNPGALVDVLHWKKGRRLFWCSTSDLFGEGVPDDFIFACLGVMHATPQHFHYVLTKRAQRMADLLSEKQMDMREALHRYTGRMVRELSPGLPTNMIAGVSVENRKHGIPRIDHLRRVPVDLRFLSIEPLLEHLGPLDLNGIAAVIVGGESGGLRTHPMHPGWVRDIRNQVIEVRAICDTCRGTKRTEPTMGYSVGPLCVDCGGLGFHGPTFMLKQWGNWLPVDEPWKQESPERLRGNERYLNFDGGHGFHGEQVWRMRPVGKGRAGNELDGRTWLELPPQLAAFERETVFP
jgi:protein gp37